MSVDPVNGAQLISNNEAGINNCHENKMNTLITLNPE